MEISDRVKQAIVDEMFTMQIRDGLTTGEMKIIDMENGDTKIVTKSDPGFATARLAYAQEIQDVKATLAGSIPRAL